MLDLLVLLLFLFAFAALLRMDWVYYLVYVVGGVWLFSHWWTQRSLRNITIERRMSHKAFTGESLEVEVRLHNRSRLPVPWLRLHEGVPVDLQSGEHYGTILSVGSRAVARYRYSLFCRQRGYYPVGPLRLRTGDLFGFAQNAWQETHPTHVTVYPQVLPLPALGLPSRLPFGTIRSHQRIFEDPTRMIGVRPYTSGDSLRHIHWRASAHEDTLLVKKYRPAIALNTAVILDLNRAAYPSDEIFSSSEWAVIVAASLAKHITEQRQAVGFLSNGLDPLAEEEAQDIPAHTGQAHLMHILELLARIQLHNAGEPLSDWLPQRAAELEWGTTLLVVTARLDETLLWSLHNLYRRGLNVLVTVCASQPGFRQIQQQAGQLGIDAYHTMWESDLAKLQKVR